MPSPKLSVCVITFNEEANIRDCLESVRWADEIVLVDSFSTDRTVEIAREYTDRIVQRKWNGIFEQRQFCLDQARGEWALCIDADERVSAELRDEVQSLVAGVPPYEGYQIRRRTWFLGRWIRHCGWYPDYKTRLFLRAKARFEYNDPHDKVVVDGRLGKLKGHLDHYTYTDISDQTRTMDSFSTAAAKRLASRGRKGSVLAIVVKPPWRFFWQYVVRGGFLDGVPGLIVCGGSAFYVFLRAAKLWEARHVPRGEKS